MALDVLEITDHVNQSAKIVSDEESKVNYTEIYYKNFNNCTFIRAILKYLKNSPLIYYQYK